MADIRNDLFDALADEQRRRILFSLLERERSIEFESPSASLEDRRPAAVERRHVHLPKLEDYGFIEWSPNGNTVEAGPRFEAIRPTLRLLVDNRDALPVASL